jgi:hypothetical protein
MIYYTDRISTRFLRNYWLLRNSQSCVTLSVSGIVKRLISATTDPTDLIYNAASIPRYADLPMHAGTFQEERNLFAESGPHMSSVSKTTPHTHTWHSKQRPVTNTFASTTEGSWFVPWTEVICIGDPVALSLQTGVCCLKVGHITQNNGSVVSEVTS